MVKRVDDQKNGQYWEQNAGTWSRLVRMGCDINRDHLNTPIFLSILPEITGMKGLDIGCGEGYNTRCLAERGAQVTGIDIAPTFIRYAEEEEQRNSNGITYQIASALELPFEDHTFDFVVAFMSLMDVPDHGRALQEAFRVLKPGGFIQFSITHPCFSTPNHWWINNDSGEHIAMAVSNYFQEEGGQVEKWLFAAAPPEIRKSTPPFEVPIFHRTLSNWCNTIIRVGFILELFHEPVASDELIENIPWLEDTRVCPQFLIIRGRKSPL